MVKPRFTNFSVRLSDSSELFFLNNVDFFSPKYLESFPKSTVVVPGNICLLFCQVDMTSLVVLQQGFPV